ncbi:thioredoxin domain-containing protein [Paramicrobacterium sp. CJ85]|uniref:thioredoxin domain-containing protein n=1 Tax=Paramicrobacterium sp. CJ85 TaxID=3445355 RepID=UPI003F5E4F3A
MNRLAESMSPYLRSHAGNPVDWHPWGEEAFAEARERDVPVFISIGYATCHWCHVMARESFSDETTAAYLNEHFVCIKVDREEHPSVDASYLAQASAFAQGLGWPLSVFTTPEGETFFAGTYFPPEPMQGRASFRQVVEAVVEAWTERREQAVGSAKAVADAVRAAGERRREGASLPTSDELAASVRLIASREDALFGGFGTAPKFPVAPALGFLLASGETALLHRTLESMAGSPLRDRDGGFFRYATQRDWSEPHYERMLYDNALLLGVYTRAWQTGLDSARDVAEGIARFLLDTLFLGWGFASGQDSESVVDGVRTEGGYFLAAERDGLEPPSLDGKVLTGWNGLAIEALARAGVVLARPDCVDAARTAADEILRRHDIDGRLRRASTAEQNSDAVATLEDYGMLACGLIELTCATGEISYLERARDLLARVTVPGGFAEPESDAVLEQAGLVLRDDPSEGAYPSGISACARASRMLWALTGDAGDRERAENALAPFAEDALKNPVGFGAVLEELTRLQQPMRQAIVIDAGGPSQIPERVRRDPADVLMRVSEERARSLAASGLTLLESRTSVEGRPTLYVCENFVCRLPETLDR